MILLTCLKQLTLQARRCIVKLEFSECFEIVLIFTSFVLFSFLFTQLNLGKLIRLSQEERMVIMSGGIFLIAIVLCISLLFRLLLSQFFTGKVFDEDLSMPLMQGLVTPSDNRQLNNHTINPDIPTAKPEDESG